MLNPLICSGELEIFQQPQPRRHVWRPVCVRRIWIWVLPAKSVRSAIFRVIRTSRLPLTLIFVPPLTDFSKEPDMAALELVGFRRDMQWRYPVQTPRLLSVLGDSGTVHNDL